MESNLNTSPLTSAKTLLAAAGSLLTTLAAGAATGHLYEAMVFGLLAVIAIMVYAYAREQRSELIACHQERVALHKELVALQVEVHTLRRGVIMIYGILKMDRRRPPIEPVDILGELSPEEQGLLERTESMMRVSRGQSSDGGK